MSYDISKAVDLDLETFAGLITLKTPRVGRYLVQPEVAGVMFQEHNNHNRKLKEAHAQNILDEIKDDTWVFTGEPAIFDWNGQMSNGQHRLWACWKAEKPIDIQINWGMDPDVIWAQDRGKTRNNGDQLYMNNVTNPKECSAVVTHYYKFERGDYLNKWGGPSGKEAVDIMRENPGIEDSTQLYKNKFKGICAASVGIFFHYLLTKIDPERGQDFVNGVITGELLDATSPILELRKRFIGSTPGYKKLSTQAQLIYWVKSWNRFYDNQKASKLTYTPRRGRGPKRKGDKTPVIRGGEHLIKYGKIVGDHVASREEIEEVEFVNPFLGRMPAAVPASGETTEAA